MLAVFAVETGQHVVKKNCVTREQAVLHAIKYPSQRENSCAAGAILLELVMTLETSPLVHVNRPTFARSSVLILQLMIL